jgi:hypothetical protein
LHRVRLAPASAPSRASSAAAAALDTTLYGERCSASAAAEDEVWQTTLTSCPQVFEAVLQFDESYNTATVASLCVLHGVWSSAVINHVSQGFFADVLRHGLCKGTSAAAVAAERGAIAHAYENAEMSAAAFSVDVFAGTDDSVSSSSTEAGKILVVDGSTAVNGTVAHLQEALTRTDKLHGNAAVVVEVTSQRLKQLRQQASPYTSPLQQQQQRDKKACVVWLRNPPRVDNDSDNFWYMMEDV